MKTIDAKGIYYRQLNQQIRAALQNREKEIELLNVNGQRYIGAGLNGNHVKITIRGTPGNDLAAFMNGPTIEVHGNCQDGVANTMNDGKIVIHGSTGDVLGYGMRGGRVLIKDNIGYRAGIHMKAYQDKIPVIIAGGTSGDFLGEYMAGGILVLLGKNQNAKFIGTGMHGGTIYIRDKIENHQLSKEVVSTTHLDNEDEKLLEKLLEEYSQHFKINTEEMMTDTYTKLQPKSSRPYKKLYA